MRPVGHIALVLQHNSPICCGNRPQMTTIPLANPSTLWHFSCPNEDSLSRLSNIKVISFFIIAQNLCHTCSRDKTSFLTFGMRVWKCDIPGDWKSSSTSFRNSSNIVRICLKSGGKPNSMADISTVYLPKARYPLCNMSFLFQFRSTSPA